MDRLDCTLGVASPRNGIGKEWIAQGTLVDICNGWVDIARNPLQLSAWYFTIQGTNSGGNCVARLELEVCSRGGRRAPESLCCFHSLLLGSRFCFADHFTVRCAPFCQCPAFE